MSTEERELQLAPYTHRNWQAFARGETPSETHEWPLFADAWFTGELRELGPYNVLNAAALARRGHARAALVLRGALCAKESHDENNRVFYHGGSHADEVAALISLCTGVRLKAGGETRRFKEGGDPLGNPMGFGGQIDYVLAEQGLQLPRALRWIDNPIQLEAGDCADRLRSFAALDGETAGVLVTASRLYQDALWMAEVEPHLAWLFFVSAVETVANHWRHKDRNHVERLTDSKPDLVRFLRERGHDDLVADVAKQIADVTGATLKFTSFILAFDPGPPGEKRLIPVDWTKLRDAVRLIYRWRSQALHGGTPFPAPMCFPPIVDAGSISERPFGLAAGTGGAMWWNEETPMLLHVFEHITRGALLRWWKEAAPLGGREK